MQGKVGTRSFAVKARRTDILLLYSLSCARLRTGSSEVNTET